MRPGGLTGFHIRVEPRLNGCNQWNPWNSWNVWNFSESVVELLNP